MAALYDAPMTRTFLLCLSLFVLLLTGCNLIAAAEDTPLPAGTFTPAFDTSMVSPIPTLARQLNTLPAPRATEAPAELTLTPDPCTPLTERVTAVHTVVADVNYNTRQVQVEQIIRYTNLTGETLPDLVLDVQPNNWPNAFMLEKISTGGQELEYELDRNRMTLPLPAPLEPGCGLSLRLEFTLSVPLIDGSIMARRGFFGYSLRQLNLGNWLPQVAPRMAGRWLIHEPIFIGEQIVLEQADWDVTLSVSGAPETLVVAAPGRVEELGPFTWRYMLQNAREFSVSMSAVYNLRQRATRSGVLIEVYTFPDALVPIEGGFADGPGRVLDEAVRAVEMFEDLFGPYPYERLLIVQGDFPDGMEFTGLVFVSGAWFYQYTGRPEGYLLLITIHEIAHQWWYARVGNDSALTPWLDEALATYSEYIYIEEYHPDLKSWWWSFRVAWYNPTGDVDATVYEFSSAREYINAVYLRGVQMLHNIREDIGTDAFFELLAQYTEVADGSIATPDVFWSLLTPEQLDLTEATRAGFLRDPDVGG